MAKNKPGLIGTLFAMGALGATAGMLAWRWSQRHRLQRQSFHRDLSRWEGEGGALAESGTLAADAAVADGAAGMADTASVARTMSDAAGAAVNGTPGDAPTGAWPFPHSNGDPATRH